MVVLPQHCSLAHSPVQEWSSTFWLSIIQHLCSVSLLKGCPLHVVTCKPNWMKWNCQVGTSKCSKVCMKCNPWIHIKLVLWNRFIWTFIVILTEIVPFSCTKPEDKRQYSSCMGSSSWETIVSVSRLTMQPVFCESWWDFSLLFVLEYQLRQKFSFQFNLPSSMYQPEASSHCLQGRRLSSLVRPSLALSCVNYTLRLHYVYRHICASQITTTCVFLLHDRLMLICKGFIITHILHLMLAVN